jgi:hypothetical protein
MRKLMAAAIAALVMTGAVQAEETWKGTISDSMCGLKHSAEKHGDKATDHRTCVEKCIAGGGEYVFLAKDKAVKIANQKFEGLKTHAGQEVMLTGEMKNDAITVTKIEAAKVEKEKK